MFTKEYYALGIGIGILNSGGAVYAVLLSLQIDRRIKFDLFLVIEIFHIIRNAARKMIFSRLKALGRLLALAPLKLCLGRRSKRPVP